MLIALFFSVFQTSRMFGSSAYRDCLASVTGIKLLVWKKIIKFPYLAFLQCYFCPKPQINSPVAFRVVLNSTCLEWNPGNTPDTRIFIVQKYLCPLPPFSIYWNSFLGRFIFECRISEFLTNLYSKRLHWPPPHHQIITFHDTFFFWPYA